MYNEYVIKGTNLHPAQSSFFSILQYFGTNYYFLYCCETIPHSHYMQTILALFERDAEHISIALCFFCVLPYDSDYASLRCMSVTSREFYACLLASVLNIQMSLKDKSSIFTLSLQYSHMSCWKACNIHCIQQTCGLDLLFLSAAYYAIYIWSNHDTSANMQLSRY